MNTYEENLRDSITQSMGRLGAQEDILAHGQLQARIALYHAKGALLAAHDKVDLEEARHAVRRQAHDAVQRAGQQSLNLLGTLAQAGEGSDAATANVGTAAANLQASADGVMGLASTVGAALNVASAAMYDTELFHQLARINDHLNQIANGARFLAVQGIEAAGKCAESIAAALADRGQDVQDRLADLGGKSAAELDLGSAAVHDARQQASDAEGAQATAAGALLDAANRSTAMEGMVRGAMRYANLGLAVEVLSAQRIKVRFQPFKPPFGDRQGRAGAAAAQVEAYLAIVPQSRADQFSNDQAAQLFGKWDGRSPTFTAVRPGENTVDLQRDVYGNPVRAGVPCCAFLYLVPGADYKRHLGNYADHVSSASAPFVPFTPLPRAMHGGAADAPRRLLLAVAAAEPEREEPQGDAAGQLAEGAARLAPHLAWLRDKDVHHDPAFAMHMDTILPPFAEALDGAVRALEARDSRAAEAADAAAQAALQQLGDWQDWLPKDPAVAEKFAAIPALVEELAEKIAQACAASGTGSARLEDALELRCILLDHAADPDVPACAGDGRLPDFLTVTVAEQVAPANYIVAGRLAAPPKGVKPPAALEGKPCWWYVAEIEYDDTDNFGNPLVPGHRYTPFVLSTTRGPSTGEWANTLSCIQYTWQSA